MDAEMYLRNLAESELRRYRGGAPENMLDASGRLRAVAAAFAGTGLLEPGVADAVVDELTTALVIRSPGDPRVRHFARVRHAHRIQPSPVPPASPVPVSVTPAPSASAVDTLVISRGADLRASAPLTWWTS